MGDSIEPMPKFDQQQLAEQFVEQSRAEVSNLVAPDGMLAGLPA